MASKPSTDTLDLTKWRKVPTILMIGGGLLALLGFFVNRQQFAFSWLLGFMFFLSLCAGALFLVIAHHLFDAGWSVSLRRFLEHIAAILPWLALLFLPILFLRETLYPWLTMNPPDHALHAKYPLFTANGFYLTAAFCFLVWWLLSNRLRYWSVKQDATGDPVPTYKMRFWACIGIFLFAISLTFAAIMWMKSMQHQWFSTMYGVWYFAGSVWMTLGTAYVITMVLDRKKILTEVLHDHQYYFLGSLMFAFTVFYAYITFSQYFIIWNANMPEETFWYLWREKGSWFYVSMVIIFGHFFIPFLALLRIDVKSVWPYMLPICIWTWLMHFVDLSFNIMPVLHPDGFVLHWLDIGCWAFMAGMVAKLFLRNYASTAPYPIRDPRLIEAMGFSHPVPTQISGGELDECDDLPEPNHSEGGAR